LALKTETTTKLKFYPTEKVEIMPIKRTLKGHRYAITNYGRAIRFDKTPEDGAFASQYLISAGYPTVYIHNNGKRMNATVHRLVAIYFLPKPSKDQVFVIHKDRDLKNNHVSNLKWVNKREHLVHAMESDAWKRAKRNHGNAKLNEDRVRMIRRKIKEGKTRRKIIAKQFGITEMQLYRIKSGENWGWVK
jgi:HNH endonuclease